MLAAGMRPAAGGSSAGADWLGLRDCELGEAPAGEDELDDPLETELAAALAAALEAAPDASLGFSVDAGIEVSELFSGSGCLGSPSKEKRRRSVTLT